MTKGCRGARESVSIVSRWTKVMLDAGDGEVLEKRREEGEGGGNVDCVARCVIAFTNAWAGG